MRAVYVLAELGLFTNAFHLAIKILRDDLARKTGQPSPEVLPDHDLPVVVGLGYLRTYMNGFYLDESGDRAPNF